MSAEPVAPPAITETHISVLARYREFAGETHPESLAVSN